MNEATPYFCLIFFFGHPCNLKDHENEGKISLFRSLEVYWSLWPYIRNKTLPCVTKHRFICWFIVVHFYNLVFVILIVIRSSTNRCTEPQTCVLSAMRPGEAVWPTPYIVRSVQGLVFFQWKHTLQYISRHDEWFLFDNICLSSYFDFFAIMDPILLFEFFLALLCQNNEEIIVFLKSAVVVVDVYVVVSTPTGLIWLEFGVNKDKVLGLLDCFCHC